MAAQLASFPATNPQPARKPQIGPRRSRPYTYVPPDSGYNAASCADEIALQNATTAAIPRPSSSPGPAAPAAGPIAANTPAPIIDPRPMTTASVTPRERERRSGTTTVPNGGVVST